VTTFRGLTWDHPRGYDSLAAAARLHAAAIDISWETQSLEGFESESIPELARTYDLIVLDHPHLGEAVAAGCLVPVGELLGAAAVERIAAATIGAAAASYVYGGRSYALPLDAATQVQVLQPALVGDRPAPATWDEVLELAAEHPLALSLAGPHAVLTFFSICAGLADGALASTAEALVPAEIGVAALELLQRLDAVAVEKLRAANPIGILEAMATERAAACCPLVYGYVNYARAAPGRREPLRFADAPLLGSALGGTGIAITRRCPLAPELARHLAWLLDGETQTTFIGAHEGQPSARSAWLDAALDERSGGFYSGTRRTTETAWVRPRFPGYIEFQAGSSELIRAGLAERMPAARLFDRLGALWRASLPTGALL
jgi:multiple sugar transport system substrate-binding protein